MHGQGADHNRHPRAFIHRRQYLFDPLELPARQDGHGRPGPGQEGREDIRILRSHPLIPDRVAIGGFMYDVDTGLLHEQV